MDIKLSFCDVDNLCICDKRACSITITDKAGAFVDTIEVCGNYTKLLDVGAETPKEHVCIYHTHAVMDHNTCTGLEVWKCHIGAVKKFTGEVCPFQLLCDCDPPRQVVIRKVIKSGINHGKTFVCCPRNQGEGCKFFRFSEKIRLSDTKELGLLKDVCSIFCPVLGVEASEISKTPKEEQAVLSQKRKADINLTPEQSSETKRLRIVREYEQIRALADKLQQQLEERDSTIADLRGQLSYFHATQKSQNFCV